MQTQFAFQRNRLDLNRSRPAGQEFVAGFRTTTREPLHAPPEPDKPAEPETLFIARGWRGAVVKAFGPVPILIPVLLRLSRGLWDPVDWVFAALFAALFVYHAATLVRSCGNGEWRRWLTIEGDGLTIFGQRKTFLAWRQVEGVARCEENGRLTLRLFLARGARVMGARWSRDGFYLDLNFRWAETPAASLDLAYGACERRLGAAKLRPFTAKPSTSIGRRFRRAFAFCGALAALLIVGLTIVQHHHPLIDEPQRTVDARPGETVMFLGNSRVYDNDLPKIVRDIADSAGSPVRYDVHMRSWLAATLRELWNDRGDRDVLQKPWGKVILQPESGAFWDEGSARDTMTFGEKLIRAAKAGGSEIALIVDWTRGPDFFDGDVSQAAEASRQYDELISRKTRALAAQTGADVIDIGGAFDEVQSQAPAIALTIGGNDPTHAGSYLAGLVIYGYLSGADLAEVKWRPYDLSAAEAAMFKTVAARHYPHGDLLRGSVDPVAPISQK